MKTSFKNPFYTVTKSSFTNRFHSSRAAVFATFLLLPMALPVSAALTWDGGGADDNWDTAANWVGDVAPVAATPDSYIFVGSIRQTPSNNIGFTSGGAVTGIQFDDAADAFVIGGTVIRVNGAAINFDAEPGTPITQTINAPLLISISSTITVTTQTNGAITLGGAITDGGAAGRLTKTGAGTLTLTGSSNFGGLVDIKEGIVNANIIANAGSNSSLGDGANSGAGTGASPIIRIGSGTTSGSLVYTGAVAATTDRQVRIGFGNPDTETGGGSIANNNANAAHTLTFSAANFIGPITTAAAVRTLTLEGTNTGLNTISGVIANNSNQGRINLTKAGSGTWVLGGLNTYTGDTTISGGTLTLGVTNAVATATDIKLGTATLKAEAAAQGQKLLVNRKRLEFVGKGWNSSCLRELRRKVMFQEQMGKIKRTDRGFEKNTQRVREKNP